MKIKDVGFTGSYNEQQAKVNELKAKSYRLKAEAYAQNFSPSEINNSGMSQLVSQEESLHFSNQSQLSNSVAIIDAQISQKQKELLESKSKREELKNANDLISQEISITEPLTKNMVVSAVQFLQMKRQAAMIKGDYDTTAHTIARINESIGELNKRRMEVVYEFRNKAKQELNGVVAQIQQINQSESVLADKVDRTIVRSPVNGTINQILINTIGGVVKPAMDLIEIVPDDDALMVEAKIKPSDIAYIYPGQKANVKFSAYDFSIYGGLKGKVKHVSADTITDDRGNSFYLVKILTDKSFLLKNGKPLEIMPGMTVDVDILTGKKTVMDFILKPILKVKQNSLGEH
jgi:adhesin transport system membrane fusion protein